VAVVEEPVEVAQVVAEPEPASVGDYGWYVGIPALAGMALADPLA
jgi:hypothetical protein